MARGENSGELALIERIRLRAGHGRGGVRIGIGDDCAVLRVAPGEEMLVTTDFSLEKRHFRRDWHSARSVGHRTLARGLSDLAAMGGRPVAAFLSLALPREVARKSAWLDGFLDGFCGLAVEFGVVLAGGDMAESPGAEVLADVVAVGSAPRGTALRRSGARVGDLLYCTGMLGGAAAELGELAKAPAKFRGARAEGEHPHLFPAPRVKAGMALRERKLATACMDISDGLSTDLAHLCESSRVGAVVETDLLPLHPLAKKLGAEGALAAALHGGEDYELLFTARPGVTMPRSIGGVAVTRIGEIVARRKSKPRMVLVGEDGGRVELKAAGWEHLR
jgi:thiamine-monophosphate kinase